MRRLQSGSESLGGIDGELVVEEEEGLRSGRGLITLSQHGAGRWGIEELSKGPRSQVTGLLIDCSGVVAIRGFGAESATHEEEGVVNLFSFEATPIKAGKEFVFRICLDGGRDVGLLSISGGEDQFAMHCFERPSTLYEAGR